MSKLDAGDREWLMAVMRALPLFDGEDTQYVLDAALRHRRRELRAKLGRLDGFTVNTASIGPSGP